MICVDVSTACFGTDVGAHWPRSSVLGDSSQRSRSGFLILEQTLPALNLLLLFLELCLLKLGLFPVFVGNFGHDSFVSLSSLFLLLEQALVLLLQLLLELLLSLADEGLLKPLLELHVTLLLALLLL